MNELVAGLAHLCSLRDRTTLDQALVALVLKAGQGSVLAARLVRLVGDDHDLHCLTRAEHRLHQPHPEHIPPWVDWRELPALVNFPLRQQARENGKIVQRSVVAQSGTDKLATLATVFAVGRSLPASTFLETESLEPLDAQLQGLIEGVLALYGNFEGLLDYGEKDALTELLNRKTFDGAFAKAAIEQTLPDSTPAVDRRGYHPEEGYWLAVIDIDHFKRVNDNFGHLIGDEVLLLMARLMRTSFRFHDQLYRFGGEEFVILMRCAGFTDAQRALERFRGTVQGYAFPQVGTITVSIGFAGLRGDDTPGGAFDRADKAVYHAKGHGRNQVVSYQTLVDAGVLVEEAAPDNEIEFF